jgi:predicted peptidase
MKTMRMIRTAVLISVAALVASPALGADEPAAGKMIKVFPQQAELLPYWLYLPKEYDGNKDKYPVLVFLHGLGERGNDLDRVLAHGSDKLIARGKHFPFIMIAPQCPNEGNLRDRNAKAFWWKAGSIDQVKNIVDHEKERLGRVDDDRVYITGLSMGGFGTYHIVSRHPKTFAAAAPICGHGNGWPDKKAVAHIPFWAFHGEQDGVVKLADQQKTVDDLKAAGAKVKFTVYPGVGHNSWTQTYANPELYEWLLAQKRGQGESQE